MHIPVLQQEVIHYLAPKPNENFIDATFGLGGHTKAILEKTSPRGKVLGIEIDRELYKKFLIFPPSNRLTLVNDSYANLKKIVEEQNFKADGILFDLGLSSWHLEESGRGFSFQKNEPLNMNYEVRSRSDLGLTSKKLVNQWPEKKIEKILREYGEERFAKRITEEIIEARKISPIETTFQLVEIIKRAVPKGYQKARRHPATKTFQALRIVTNRELENLKTVLPQALDILKKEGRIVIISFHSLEDRIVKNFFREQENKGRLNILTKKPIRPCSRELVKNPRARSAKLRAAVKPHTKGQNP